MGKWQSARPVAVTQAFREHLCPKPMHPRTDAVLTTACPRSVSEGTCSRWEGGGQTASAMVSRANADASASAYYRPPARSI